MLVYEGSIDPYTVQGLSMAPIIDSLIRSVILANIIAKRNPKGSINQKSEPGMYF